MGYTHYWYMKNEKEISEEKWNGLMADAKKLLEGSPILERAKQNREWDNWIDLDITENMIRYDGGHETFVLERKPKNHPWRAGDEWVFNFCKTARKEYDGLVTATLLLAKHHLGDEIKITSDGGAKEWAEGAWEGTPSGYELTKEILNETEHKAVFKATMADLIRK
jgi:hypothetical protein